MPNVVKNLVVGGVDVHLRQHGEKGFRVKYARNFNFNNGFIYGSPPLVTLASLVVADGSALYDSETTVNQIYIP